MCVERLNGDSLSLVSDSEGEEKRLRFSEAELFTVDGGSGKGVDIFETGDGLRDDCVEEADVERRKEERADDRSVGAILCL